MAAEVKKEEHEALLRLHRNRLDEGVQAIQDLLLLQQTRVSRAWIDATGDELLQLQGEARAIRYMLKRISETPREQS